MNRTFEHTITWANYMSSYRGSYRNLFGGWRAKFFMYAPLLVVSYVCMHIVLALPLAPILRFALLVVMGVILITVWLKKYCPYISQRLAEHSGIPWQDMRQKIYVDKVGITVVGDHIKTQFEWQAIGRIINAHGNVYFYFGQFCIVLPTSKFENDADIESFIAQCQDYREQAREYDEKK